MKVSGNIPAQNGALTRVRGVAPRLRLPQRAAGRGPGHFRTPGAGFTNADTRQQHANAQGTVKDRMALSLIIVNPDPAVLAEQLVCFQREGFAVAGTTSFVDARALIAVFHPNALVTAIRIGEYNGLHLAILARTKYGDLPTIVLGGEDPVLEREAENTGAQYVLTPIHPGELVTVVRRAMMGEVVPRRWPRVRPTGTVAAVVGGQKVSVVDISYGGLGISVPRSAAAALPREFKVALPELGVTVTAERVWSRAEADHVRYGLQLPTTAPDGIASWRAVVEALRGVTANN